ncbi:hypothetical protein PT974_08951 [Cladobotryum mycophilum]|uniref:dihydroneopterin aldolase n=1 Tax=Cladobotryum mycophilum TaxID=491253 RepID=A0ABR0SEU2_9HYPO
MVPPVKRLWQIRAAAADSPAVVRVRNLQASVTGPSDAWGRDKRPQPISVSAAVSFDRVFGSSSSTDTVASDTVHYGLLSKAILASLSRPVAAEHRSPIDGDNSEPARTVEKPFLDPSGLRCVEIKVHLPKASLLGDGVSVTQIALFSQQQGSSRAELEGTCTSLGIHDLRIPTLIGVNDNEREAKQVVVANLEIDHVASVDLDLHYTLVAEVVKIMSESSFETLEALAKDISIKIANLLHQSFRPHSREQPSWGLRISLEKPIAVVFADAACVELSINTADIINSS